MLQDKIIKPDKIELSAEARLEAVATILAAGLIRQRILKSANSQKAREGLALSPNRCVIGGKTTSN